MYPRLGTTRRSSDADVAHLIPRWPIEDHCKNGETKEEAHTCSKGRERGTEKEVHVCIYEWQTSAS
jgi:hypothetical protein